MEQLLVGIKCEDKATPILEKFKRSVNDATNSSTGSFLALAGVAGLAFNQITEAIGKVGAIMKAALAPSVEMEKLTVQFGVLLGTTEDAKKRMEELAKFVETTPFELQSVAKASKTLETLTKGALSTGPGLRLVGDAAAAADVPMEELSVTIGRLYDGLQSGRAVGESMARLQELGLLSGETRGELEKLQKEGKKGDEVWNVAAKSLGQYGGMMDEQSKTFSGVASNFDDSISSVLREFGDQILPDVKGQTSEFITVLNDLKPVAAGVGFVVSSVIKLFREAYLGLMAFAQGVIPLIITQIGIKLADSISDMIGYAEKVNEIFGKILPKSWSEGLKNGLGGAKEWVGEMKTELEGLSDASVGILDEYAGKMAAVYQEEDTSKTFNKPKKGKGGGGSGGGNSDQQKFNLQQAEDEIKLALKTQQEIAKLKEGIILASLKDEREKEITALGFKFDEEQLAAGGNVEKLKLIQERYRIDLATINEKFDKKDMDAKIKAKEAEIKLAEDALKKSQEVQEKAKENLAKHIEEEKKLFESLRATINEVVSQPLNSMVKTMGTWVTSMGKHGKNMRDTFRSFWSDIQDSFGNMCAKMVTDWVVNKAAMYAKDAAMYLAHTVTIGGISKGAQAVSVAESQASGAAIAEAQAPAAMMSSVASWGGAAVIAGIALAGLYAAVQSYHANGTNYAYGGLTMVGEKGPELLNLPRGSQVMNNENTNRMLGGGNNYNLTFNNTGITAKDVTRELKRMDKENSRTRRS